MDELRKHLIELLEMKGAHLDFDSAVRGFPVKIRGVKPKGSPHTAWELLEHMRIAQSDILEFSRDAKHVSPVWPAGYWPDSPKPPSEAAWQKSVKQFKHDLEEMKTLISNPKSDLYARIAHGDGQTLLREALLVADHNSYHLGQLMSLRKMLEARGA